MGDGEVDMHQQDFSYGDHELQRLTVYNPFSNNLSTSNGLWIIYIHGGGWRDPTITQTSFLPTISHLLSHPLRFHVTAFASLDYRLSPHPDHPQDPSTPPSQLRNATHPDHLNDVLSGISFLQEKYGFGTRYLLVGHSCGATIAFQTVMRSISSPRIQSPSIIVGVAGIYNLRLLRDKNSHPIYQEFLTGAFGEDEKIWDQVSPAEYTRFEEWKEGELAVLVTSTGDVLVDEAQIDAMEVRLGGLDKTKLSVKNWKGMLDMGHDEIWEDGKGLGSVIEKVLEYFKVEDPHA